MITYPWKMKLKMRIDNIVKRILQTGGILFTSISLGLGKNHYLGMLIAKLGRCIMTRRSITKRGRLNIGPVKKGGSNEKKFYCLILYMIFQKKCDSLIEIM